MRKQLTDLRRRMVQEKIDAYLIPSDDFHGSEYVGDHFKCRGYVSGFTGSAGTLLVTADWAGLWTDGRYFLQAAQQLDGSGITLCKMGEKNVPTEEAYLKETLRPGQCLGFDGRTVTAKRFHALETALDGLDITFRTDVDLAGDGWPNRPPLSAAPAWALDEAYCGRSRAEKLAQIRRLLSERKADVLLLSSLDDIAWLLNLRGGDVACCPVVLSFLALTASDTQLFVNPSVLPEALKNALAADGITLAPYDGIYAYAAALPAHSTVWLDEEKTSCALWRAAAHCPIVSAANPTLLPKAIKNAAEIANERTAHLRDGAALTQWIFWLKATVGRSLVTERSAAEKLEALRARQPHYLEPSFDPGLFTVRHRRSLSRRHHGRNPHHCPRTCVGRHEAPLHAGAAQPPAPAPRSVPVRLPWQCPGHDRPPASMAGRPGLQPWHRPRRGISPQRPRGAEFFPVPLSRAGCRTGKRHDSFRRAGPVSGGPLWYPSGKPSGMRRALRK